jgi:hypothetical protein
MQFLCLVMISINGQKFAGIFNAGFVICKATICVSMEGANVSLVKGFYDAA